MKRLIINADDCGADKERNEGIFEAVNRGSVTSASLLANGPATDNAIHLAKGVTDKHISWGLHINLSEGRPLSSGLRLLTGSDGYFLGKLPAIRLLASDKPRLSKEGEGRAGAGNVMGGHDTPLGEEIRVEVEAQIKALSDTGIPIRHIDGHHHIHMFPAVIGAVIKIAAAYKIPWIRIPEEPAPFCGGLPVSEQLAEEARFFSKHAAEARTLLKKTGIRTADHFRGLYLKGTLSPALMEDLFQTLPDGLTELMVHPGRPCRDRLYGPFSAFSTHDRERELTTLLHHEFPLLLEKYKIILTPFPEI